MVYLLGTDTLGWAENSHQCMHHRDYGECKFATSAPRRAFRINTIDKLIYDEENKLELVFFICYYKVLFWESPVCGGLDGLQKSIFGLELCAALNNDSQNKLHLWRGASTSDLVLLTRSAASCLPLAQVSALGVVGCSGTNHYMVNFEPSLLISKT